jgi:hypothetical protein
VPHDGPKEHNEKVHQMDEVRYGLLGRKKLGRDKWNNQWRQGYQGYNGDGTVYLHSCSRLKMHL